MKLKRTLWPRKKQLAKQLVSLHVKLLVKQYVRLLEKLKLAELKELKLANSFP